MNIEIIYENDVPVVNVIGRIDSISSKKLQNKLEDFYANGITTVIINMAKVTMIIPKVLIYLQEDIEMDIKLVAVPRHIMHLFETFDSELAMFKSVKEALKSIDIPTKKTVRKTIEKSTKAPVIGIFYNQYAGSEIYCAICSELITYVAPGPAAFSVTHDLSLICNTCCSVYAPYQHHLLKIYQSILPLVHFVNDESEKEQKISAPSHSFNGNRLFTYVIKKSLNYK